MHTLINGPDAFTEQKILYCGHGAHFTGDIIITPLAVTVITKPEVEKHLQRKNFDGVAWHISDAHGGYWQPRKGRFVLPREAVTPLTPDNIHLFLRTLNPPTHITP